MVSKQKFVGRVSALGLPLVAAVASLSRVPNHLERSNARANTVAPTVTVPASMQHAKNPKRNSARKGTGLDAAPTVRR